MKLDIKAGTAQKRIGVYLTYIGILRRAIGHPFLLEDSLQKELTLDQMNSLRTQLSKTGGRERLCEQLQHWVPHLEYTDKKGNLWLPGSPRPLGGVRFGRSGFGGFFNMDAKLERLQKRMPSDDIECRKCYKTTREPQQTEVSYPPLHTCNMILKLASIDVQCSAVIPSATSALT